MFATLAPKPEEKKTAAAVEPKEGPLSSGAVAQAWTPLFLRQLDGLPPGIQRQPDGGAGQSAEEPGQLDERAEAFLQEHAGRRHRLDEMARGIDLASDARRDLQARIDALPRISAPEAERDRTSLEAEIHQANEHLEEQLLARIALLDEAFRALEDARPLFPDAAANDPEAFWVLEQRRLDQERLLAVQRPLARRRIQEIEAELQRPVTDERRAELEERRKSLGDFLSSTAQRRTPPGTAGKTNGKVYVVYANEVKAGGSLPWVNNNPGNVAPAKYQARPAGAIGVNPAGTAGGFYIFATVEDGLGASMGWIERLSGMRLDAFLMWYSQGQLDQEPDLAKREEKRAEGEAYILRVLGWCHLDRGRVISSLSPEEKAAFHQAIQKEESGGAAAMSAGDTYTCGQSSAPPEFRRMLGCDE